MSFILKVVYVGLLIPATAGSASGSVSLVALVVITQFSDQVKVKDTLQLINRIFSDLKEKLLRFFNGTTISTSSFSTLLPSNFTVILVL